MKTTSPSSRPRFGFFAATAFALCAFLFPAAASAMLVSLTVSYSSADLAAAKLTNGSIVQVIAYNHNTSSFPSSVTAGNFFEQYATVSENDPAYEPGVDTEVFFAESVPEGHALVYTGHIQLLDDGVSYGIVTDFVMDNTYDSLYLRVFEATDFPQGQVVLSCWGVSDAPTEGISPSIEHYNYTDTANADHRNYFEVIPEPASLSLFALGSLALAAFRRKSDRRSEGGLK